MPNIASASILLSTNSGPMDSGLASAEKKINNFSKKTDAAIGKGLAAGGGGVGDGLGAALSNAGPDGAVLASLLGLVGAVGAAFDATFGSLVRLITPSFSQMRAFATATKDTSRAARSLGVDFEALQGLQIASRGIEPEQLNRALMRMNRTVGEAVIHSGAARDAFEQLGITTEQLQGQTPDQTYLAVADALSQVDSQSQKTRLAMAVFGKGGGELLNSMRNGAAGIREAQEEARRLGLGLTNLEANKLSNMSSAFSRLDRILPSIQRHIAAALAPAFTSLANAGLKLWEMIRPFAEFGWNAIGVVFEVIGAAVSELIDDFVGLVGNTDEWTMSMDEVRASMLPGLRLISIALGKVWDILQMGSGLILTMFAQPFVDACQSILSALEQLLTALGEVPIFGDVFAGAAAGLARFRESLDGTAAHLENVGAAMFQGGQQGHDAEINGFFDRLEERARQAPQRVRGALDAAHAALLSEIHKMEDSLRDAFAVFGQTSEEAAITRLQLEHGGNDADFDRLRSLADVNLGQRLNAEAHPTVALQTELNRLNRLVLEGRIAWDTYGQQVDNALAHAEQALGISNEIKLSGAVFAGSKEAIEAITRFQLQGQDQQLTPQERMLRVQQEQRTIQQQNLRVNEDALRELANLNLQGI